MPTPDEAGVPEWFVQALTTRPEHREVEVEGARVHYRVWGDRALPTSRPSCTRTVSWRWT